MKAHHLTMGSAVPSPVQTTGGCAGHPYVPGPGSSAGAASFTIARNQDAEPCPSSHRAQASPTVNRRGSS